MYIYIHICHLYVYSRTVSPSVSARVSPARRERKNRREGEKARAERRGRIRAGDQACVYTERRREWRGGGGWEEGEINVFVLRPPSYAPERERSGWLAALARDLTARRMAEATWPGSTVEYQPSVIAFVCKRRLFPSRSTSSITTHLHPAIPSCSSFLRGARIRVYIGAFYIRAAAIPLRSRAKLSLFYFATKILNYLEWGVWIVQVS